MYRYVIHTWEPAPQLEGDRWPAVLCPPDSNPEVLGEGQCRIRIGGSAVTFTAVRCPHCGSPGPAFEVTAGDDLSAPVATRLFSGIWDRFSRAVTRPLRCRGAGARPAARRTG